MKGSDSDLATMQLAPSDTRASMCHVRVRGLGSLSSPCSCTRATNVLDEPPFGLLCHRTSRSISIMRSVTASAKRNGCRSPEGVMTSIDARPDPTVRSARANLRSAGQRR